MSAFMTMYRVDNRDYPVEALREALLNAMVHRDYALNASTLISIFSNRLEIVTVGGLVRGIAYEDLMLGVSVLRNPHLANIFYRLALIEAYGTGVLKIRRSYAGFPVQPLIQVTNNAFKITLPNMNAAKTSSSAPSKISSREDEVLALLREKGRVTRSEVQSALQVSQPTAILLLRKMKENGLIDTQGRGRFLAYVCPPKRSL